MIIESLMKAQSGRHLAEEEAFGTFREVMNGEVTGESLLAALLTALQMNGPDTAEVTGAVRAMRSVCLRVEAPEDAVDIVGTGGDGFGTFNVSTTAAIIAAGAGVTIAKHGNKASTSKSGSADCLAALGYNLVTPLEDVARGIRENGIGFLFANRCHPAMMYAAPVRRTLPFRTIFNLIGPLSNPAGVKRYALGVYAPEIISLYIGVLRALGTKKALVFWEYTFDPERYFGCTRPLSAIAGGTPEMNAQITRRVLTGEERGAYRDAAALNAAAAIVAAGKADRIEEGIEFAYAAIDSGAALAKLQLLVAANNTND